MSNRSIKYLEKIYNHLDDEYNKILNNSSTSTDNDGLSLLDSERIIQYLTLSILTAEYYSKDFYSIIKKIKDFLNDFKTKIKDLTSTSSASLAQLENIINEIKTSKCLYYYTEFKKELDSSLENEPKIFIESKYIKYLKENEIRDNKNIWILNANLFLAKLDEGFICDKETLTELIILSTKLNRWVEENNIGIDDSNNSTDETPYYNLKVITEHKFIFLIYKILLRFEKTLHKEFVVTNELDHNTTDLNIENIKSKFSIETIENDFIDNKTLINKYFEKNTHDINKIYPKDPENTLNIITQHNIFNELNTILNKNKLSVCDIHFIFKVVKYNVKEINRNNNKYQKLINKLKTTEEEYRIACGYRDIPTPTIDDYSNYTSFHLICNTIQRIELNKKLFSINSTNNVCEINTILLEIDDIIVSKIQELSDNNKNLNNNISANRFNPAFQFGTIIGDLCKEILQRLIIQIQDKKIDIYDSDFSKLLTITRSIISKTISHLEKCIETIEEVKEKKVLPIYLHLEECEINIPEIYLDKQNDIKEKNVALCSDSAYVLPSNYDFLYKCIRGRHISKIRNLEFELNNVINKGYSIDIEAKLLGQFNDKKEAIDKNLKDQEKKSKEEFDKLIKESQMNSIQIIALYASFITFILGSISIIPKFEVSYKNLMLFLLVFSTSLCLFLFMLRILISNKDEKYNNFYEIFGVINKNKEDTKGKYEFRRELIVFIFFGLLLISTLGMLWCNRQMDHKFYKNSTKEEYLKQIKRKSDSIVNKNIIDTIHCSTTTEESNYLPPKEDKSK